ncbi:DEAD/DEAH box helicase [Sulfuriferula thiophila]|uniref:DEAD/DEAH box helicase n=1 Tax=Sulfuriferula thiophila TaxID=1781211 RepID=UPI000F6125F5|nr:DEAD/DEAH box helicase [Sulfuriferula thiophila]
MAFSDLGLVPEILRAVEECGYTEPTPVQAQVIPVVLTGCDVMAGAQTGTGKTAGFTLPMLSRLAPFATNSPSPARHPIRALILIPTRELAMQVEESVHKYGKYLPLRTTVVYGGVNMNAQIDILRGGIDILVATPGRLLDHVQNKTINLSQVQMLILDEADRMLDMGFMPDLRRIIELLPVGRQNLMFSATFSGEIKKLADSIMNNPQLIEVARRNAVAETVKQVAHPVHKERKHALLTHLIRSRQLRQVLVFCGTKLGANRLAQHLNRDGIPANAIHGDKTQQARVDALDQFKQGAIQVLVATDVAARGIDIDQLPFVVNYDLPHAAEDYVHRIGRTGRAGASGEALSLVSEDELRYLADIEKLLNMKIPAEIVPGFEPALGAMPEPARAPRPRTERPPRPLAADAEPPRRERVDIEVPDSPLITRNKEPGQRKQVAALFLPPAPRN